METVKAVRIGQVLVEADLVIIGASNGLDMAEGLNLFRADAHFRETYGDLAQADGIGCILQGLASPDATCDADGSSGSIKRSMSSMSPARSRTGCGILRSTPTPS